MTMNGRESHVPIILASASPRRRELMQLLGVPFTVLVAGIDEDIGHDRSPIETVCRLSREKGRAVAKLAVDSHIVSSDTIVVLDDQTLGKPATEAEAHVMLRALRGRAHHVLSAVTVIDQARGTETTDWVDTRVEMRDYSDEEVRGYVRSGDPLDKAGAYGIQHADFHPVLRIEGCYAGVMGFPLCHLYRILAAHRSIHFDAPAARCMRFTGHACTYYPQVLAAP